MNPSTNLIDRWNTILIKTEDNNYKTYWDTTDTNVVGDNNKLFSLCNPSGCKTFKVVRNSRNELCGFVKRRESEQDNTNIVVCLSRLDALPYNSPDKYWNGKMCP